MRSMISFHTNMARFRLHCFQEVGKLVNQGLHRRVIIEIMEVERRRSCRHFEARQAG